MNNFKFLKGLSKINWEAFLWFILEHFGQLLFATIIFGIINRVLKNILKRSFEKKAPINQQPPRSQTLYAIIKNILRYTMLFFYLYTILSILGVPVETLIAGAGVLSVAIGLGTQGLVSDVINGITILVEGQIRVGDGVTIQNIDGTVVSIGLRTVEVKAIDGTLHYIPNRSITTISNHSQNVQTISIFLRIKNPFDIEEAKKNLHEGLAHFKKSSDKIKSEPIILAPVIDKTRGFLGIQVSLQVKPGFQSAMQTKLLDHCLTILKSSDIQIEN